MKMTEREERVCEAIKEAINKVRPRIGVKPWAQLHDLNPHRISHITQKKTRPDEADIAAVREALDLSETWPYDSPRLDGARKGETVSLSGTPLYEMPVIGSASAGPGIWNVDTERRIILVPERLKALGAIGFIVDGDSMMPMLEEYDTAVFKEQRRVSRGRIFLIKIPQEGYVIKMTLFERGDWYLYSLNRSYRPYPLPEGSEVVGLLVGWYRTRGTREKMDSDPEGLTPDEEITHGVF